jgi:hypothetical protein
MRVKSNLQHTTVGLFAFIRLMSSGYAVLDFGFALQKKIGSGPGNAFFGRATIANEDDPLDRLQSFKEFITVASY